MTYEDQHARLTAYLDMKVEQCDWHGVSDAANDLRVLEAENGYGGGRDCFSFPVPTAASSAARTPAARRKR